MKAKNTGKFNPEEVERALRDLIEMGLVIDTGRREWSNETGRFHTVWGLAEDAKKPS